MLAAQLKTLTLPRKTIMKVVSAYNAQAVPIRNWLISQIFAEFTEATKHNAALKAASQLKWDTGADWSYFVDVPNGISKWTFVELPAGFHYPTENQIIFVFEGNNVRVTSDFVRNSPMTVAKAFYDSFGNGKVIERASQLPLNAGVFETLNEYLARMLSDEQDKPAAYKALRTRIGQKAWLAADAFYARTCAPTYVREFANSFVGEKMNIWGIYPKLNADVAAWERDVVISGLAHINSAMRVSLSE
jgi:hypothetical protein